MSVTNTSVFPKSSFFGCVFVFFFVFTVKLDEILIEVWRMFFQAMTVPVNDLIV